MKSILVSSVEGYSGKSAVIIATIEKIDEILGKARIRGDAKIRWIKELVERVLDLGRLWGTKLCISKHCYHFISKRLNRKWYRHSQRNMQ